jgi:hypothetical protein
MGPPPIYQTGLPEIRGSDNRPCLDADSIAAISQEIPPYDAGKHREYPITGTRFSHKKGAGRFQHGSTSIKPV